MSSTDCMQATDAYQAGRKAATDEIAAWLREEASLLQAALNDGREPSTPITPAGARRLAYVIENWGQA